MAVDINLGIDTDIVIEGTTNKYYSETLFNASLAAKSTSNLAEGSNLYYTQARFNSAFSAKSTSDLSEGANLYYTQSRFDSALAAKSTTNISEGTNLYFTNARAIGATLTGYTSGAGTISASDNILQAIQKLNGNVVAFLPTNSPNTGDFLRAKAGGGTEWLPFTTNTTLALTLTNAALDTVLSPLELSRTTSGTAASIAAGFGSGILFRSMIRSGSTVDIGAIECILSAATLGAEVTQIRFKAIKAGAGGGLSEIGFIEGSSTIGKLSLKAGSVYSSITANDSGYMDITAVNGFRFGAQNMRIGATGTPDGTAVIDMVSTTRGLLPPRMTTSQKNAISSPANHLIVVDTNLNTPAFRSSAGAWKEILTASQNSTGDIGIGVAAATDSFLKIAASTSTKVGLAIGSGLVSSPVAGALEFDGNKFYITNVAGRSTVATNDIDSLKADNETYTSDTALATISDGTNTFSRAVKASGDYLFEATLFVTCNSTGGIKIHLNNGEGAPMSYENLTVRVFDRTTDTCVKVDSINFITPYAITGYTDIYIKIEGFFRTTGADDNIYFEAAQQASNASATTILRGSFMKTTLL